MVPSIYISLEDDVARIVARLKKEKAASVMLVCPKRCSLFSDIVNLKLLKKQADLLGKEIFILTMDEKGQGYAREAGFQLKFLPKGPQARNFSDISAKPARDIEKPVRQEPPIVEKPISVAQSAAKILKSAVAATTRTSAPKIEVSEAFFPKEIEESHRLTASKRSNQNSVAALVSGSLVIILIVVFVILPKATVVIYPKTQSMPRDLLISISTAAKQADASRLILPASKVVETVEVQNKFTSQGKKEVGNKAAGTVRIYNFTRLPLNLKTSTTVLTAGSKNYYLAEDVTALRPTTYKNAKTKEIDESSLGAPINIVAAEGGESYNLPAGVRMEITNQVLGSKPQVLYAKSDTPVTGGTSRYLSVVSDQDISASQQALTAQALQQLQDKLAGQNLTLPDKSYQAEVVSFTSDKTAGTESPTFQSGLKIKFTGLAINGADLKKLIYDRINQTISDSQGITISGDSQITDFVKSLDLTNELAVLSAHFDGQAIYNVDLRGLAPTLEGKSPNQVNEILKARPEIEKVDVTLAPVWQKNFPWFARNIDIKLAK